MTTEDLPIWGRIEQWFEAVTRGLNNLNLTLRPLTGRLNVHSLPSDSVGVATYTLQRDAGPGPSAANTPTSIQTGMTKGIGCRVTFNVLAGDVCVAGDVNGDPSNAFRLPAGVFTLNTRDDLWMFVLPGSPTATANVSVCVETFDAP